MKQNTQDTSFPALPGQIPISVNLHFWKPCNYRCKFCFAVFDDDPHLQRVKNGLSLAEGVRLIELLRRAGAQKLNFVGGEPTLCQYIGLLLAHAKASGLVTSIVTNGERLDNLLAEHASFIDWVGLSVDSALEEVEFRLGRGKGGHVARSRRQFETLHQLGIRVKLNTTVTRLTWEEDMSEFVFAVRPERWKVFQVLPVSGQNDAGIRELTITPEQFAQFVDRHQGLRHRGVVIVPESNEDMTGSYCMVDPLGRFFDNIAGTHRYSRPILEVGVEAAFADIRFHPERFVARGGRYDWGRPVPLTVFVSR
ncbi:MAG: hypothetical protein AMXMBFR58_00050 [Phycisphaerae bacterium]